MHFDMLTIYRIIQIPLQSQYHEMNR